MNQVQQIFFRLSSAAMDSCSLRRDAYEKAAKDWLCLGCASPKPGLGAIDATIDEVEPEVMPLNFLFGCGLGIARADFLFSFGETTVQRDLHIGQVFNENGKLLDEWVTFNGKHRIFIRGTHHAQYRRCLECGKGVYFALGRHYLSPAPPASVDIFDEGNGGLVISEQLIGFLTLNKWRKLKCEKLEILGAPLDGLGNVPLP
jgi:hypothetical protein